MSYTHCTYCGSAPVNPDDGRQWLMDLIAKENHCQHCQG